MLSLVGLTDQQQFELPSVQKCVAIWEKASGTKVVAPQDLKAGPDGKREEIWITVRDYCSDLNFFKEIATRNGPNLNVANWTDTVNHFGAITLVGSSAGTLGQDKYDANDTRSRWRRSTRLRGRAATGSSSRRFKT